VSVPICQDRVIEKGALAAVSEVAARHGLGTNLMLVCDDTTYVAAGQQLYVTLLATHAVTPHSIGRRAYATFAAAENVMSNANGMTGILAVGGGTVNDIAKYAASQMGIPYLCIPTAASMNGYTSATSSLEHEGMKLSFSAAPPRAVVADMDVICSAPKRLARAGVGDTLCRTTVEADCLLSHHLFGTPYPREDFEMMRRHEGELIGQISKIKENSPKYLALLMLALLDAGDAMARVGSSITASQGEHMIAHTLELIYSSELSALHGELIAVTTMTMNDLHNKMLLTQPVVKSLPREEEYFARVFGKKMGSHVASKYVPKVLNAEQVTEINDRVAREWPEMKRQLGYVIIQNSAIQRAYVHGNIPAKPKDINMNEERYNAAVTYAYLTRNRFTFLDLAQMMGRRA